MADLIECRSNGIGSSGWLQNRGVLAHPWRVHSVTGETSTAQGRALALCLPEAMTAQSRLAIQAVPDSRE